MSDKPLTVFNHQNIDQAAIDQIINLLMDERAVKGALMGDAHLGYSMPIGGVIAYQDAISPSGVGFDIACGNMAVKTDLNIFSFGVEESSSSDGHMVPDPTVFKPIMREIQRTISFGMGRSNPEPIDHELFDDPAWSEIREQFGKGLKDKARAQLGTVGSGNHYVDLLVGSKGHIWVANHFGSRGLGHTIASGFMAAAAGLTFIDRVPESEEAVVFDANSYLGEFYLEAMYLAGQYAYAGREYVIDQVLKILGAEAVETVHNHHNYAWLEDGLWIVRKGATPLTSEPAFIGGSMGDNSVIVKGVNPRLFSNASQAHHADVPDLGNLGSAPHGAGRVMSRTKAAGKMRKYTDPETGKKYRARDKSTAAIDWDAERQKLNDRGIIVLGAGADEAPGVYKSLEAVLSAHANIEILEVLRPIGVVMAGPDERDPYAD